MMDNNEIIFDKSPETSFVAHLENKSEFRIDGKVYQIVLFEKGFGYMSKSTFSSGVHESLSDDSRLMFSFIYESHCGAWEGRLEFPDEEYWSTELAEMNKCWNKLESILRKRISKNIEK